MADVHANLPAFQAVLDDAGSVDEIIFLGDIVVCGPHPNQCVELLRDCGARAIVGNHDKGVLAIPALDPPPDSWEHWTYRQLNRSQRRYLAGLPESFTIASAGETARVVHRVSKTYLHPAMPDALLVELSAEAFGGFPERIVYSGHSHRLIKRVVDGRQFVCFHSIGQPRDGDPRAGYAIHDDGLLEHRRVAYDVERTVHDLRRMDLLPAPSLARWIRFVRTGHDPEWSREYP